MEKINKRWVLAKRPKGMPEDECWKLEDAPGIPFGFFC
jgi:hypothetical protein